MRVPRTWKKMEERREREAKYFASVFIIYLRSRAWEKPFALVRFVRATCQGVACVKAYEDEENDDHDENEEEEEEEEEDEENDRQGRRNGKEILEGREVTGDANSKPGRRPLCATWKRRTGEGFWNLRVGSRWHEIEEVGVIRYIAENQWMLFITIKLYTPDKCSLAMTAIAIVI